MAYTPSVTKSKTVPDNFGGLRTDGNRVAMMVGNTFQVVDATDTPVTSPVTVNTTQVLTVPQGAVSVTISSTTNPVRVSDDSTNSVYFALPAATPWEFECANQQYVYLSTSGSTVVDFFFKVV